MRIASPEISPYLAGSIRSDVVGKMNNIQDKGQALVRNFDDSGYGTGFNWETKKGDWNLQVDPTDGKPQAFDYHYEYTDDKLFSDGHYRKVQDLRYRLQPDGSQLFERQTWAKGLGLVSDKIESLHVDKQGKETCQVLDQSPRFDNWRRENPSLNKLGSLAVGGAVGGILGYCLGGGAAATLTATVGAAFAVTVAKEFAKDNRDAPQANRESSLRTPVNVLATGVQTLGVGAAVLGGLALLTHL